MSQDSKDSPVFAFLASLFFFSFATWMIWNHYQTVRGLVALATVIDKERTRGKNSYNYRLTIRYVQANQQAATSYLGVSEEHYAGFAPGDMFPIKYAKNSPDSTGFVGERFYDDSIATGYAVLALLLLFTFWGVRQKVAAAIPLKKSRNIPLTSPSKPALPAHYVALTWALLGAATFAGGIVSCRNAPLPTPPTEDGAYEYRHALLLGVRYTRATNQTMGLVQLTGPDGTSTAQMPLLPNQFALLYARLTRPQPQDREVLVAYQPDTPEQVLLADTFLEAMSDTLTETPSGIDYNTLGVVLCGVGSIVFVIFLTKYVNHLNE